MLELLMQGVPTSDVQRMLLLPGKTYAIGRDATSNITTVDEWVSMGQAMGLTQQGGPAPLPRRPAPKAAAPHKHPGS